MVCHCYWCFLAHQVSFHRSHLCGYDLNLTYPQKGLLPDVKLIAPTQRQVPFALSTLSRKSSFFKELFRRSQSADQSLTRRDREERKNAWKRDLSLRENGTIDPWVSFRNCGVVVGLM